MQRIAIIGAGRLGGALAIALSRVGYQIGSIVGRDRSKLSDLAANIESTPNLLLSNELDSLTEEVVLISTGDDAIESVAIDLAATGSSIGADILHTSGSISSEILAPLRASGSSVGSIHPLVSVSAPQPGAERFAGAYFCVEGDPGAAATAAKLVERLGGTPFSVPPGRKALYHASAVMACGHLVALIDASIESLSKCGLTNETAHEVLLPLISSTVTNLATQSTSVALTGTFARADHETFERHLGALRSGVSDEILSIYLVLGERSLDLAEKQGADAAGIEKIRRKMDELRAQIEARE